MNMCRWSIHCCLPWTKHKSQLGLLASVGLSMIMSIFKYNLIIMGWLWLKYTFSVFTHWSNTFNYHIITIQLQYNMTFLFDHINCLSNAVESRQNKWHKAVPAVLNTSKLSRPTISTSQGPYLKFVSLMQAVMSWVYVVKCGQKVRIAPVTKYLQSYNE
jgi:hypothetical protein